MSRVKAINSSFFFGGGGQKSGPAMAGMAGTAPTALAYHGLSDQWCVGPMVCRTNGVSDQWCVGPMVCRTNDGS